MQCLNFQKVENECYGAKILAPPKFWLFKEIYKAVSRTREIKHILLLIPLSYSKPTCPPPAGPSAPINVNIQVPELAAMFGSLAKSAESMMRLSLNTPRQPLIIGAAF